MSITFNNLRKDILGEDLATECDNDVAEILKKHIEIYELSKKPKSSQTMIQIGELYYQINVLISKRDALTNTITSNYLLSPDLSGFYLGRFLCNSNKNSNELSRLNTEAILNFLNKNYNVINIIKKSLGNDFYEICKERDLFQEEISKISNIKNIDVSDVSLLCSNLRKEKKIIPNSLLKYYRPMYTQKEYIMIDFEKLFRSNIALREEIITNVKRFVDKEFEQWRTLVSGWREKNSEHDFVYGDMDNFTKLTNYLTENVNKPDLYRTIRERRPDITSKITILNPLWEFYSAYPSDMTNQEFSQKNYIWLTPEITQSLLYILGATNKPLSQPVIFKFKFKRPLILLNSQTQDNTDISGMFLTRDGFTPDEFNAKTNKIFNILGRLNNADNSKILYFIDAINKLINDENYRIDGYRNRQDQNEIAVVDLSSVIDENSIVKGRFQKVTIMNKGPHFSKELIFPFNPPVQFNIPGYKTATWNLKTFRVNCPSDLTKINEATGIPYIVKPKLLYTLQYNWEGDEKYELFNCLGDPSLGNIEEDEPQYVNDV